jgi:hypothetical protein
MGAKGGGARRYNAKTGRWDKLTYETKRTVSKPASTPSSTTTSIRKKDTSTTARLEGNKRRQPVTRIGGTVKLGAAKFVKPTAKTPNRPTRGKPMQITTDRSGQQRWVAYVKPKEKK